MRSALGDDSRHYGPVEHVRARGGFHHARGALAGLLKIREVGPVPALVLDDGHDTGLEPCLLRAQPPGAARPGCRRRPALSLTNAKSLTFPFGRRNAVASATGLPVEPKVLCESAMPRGRIWPSTVQASPGNSAAFPIAGMPARIRAVVAVARTMRDRLVREG